MFTADQALRGKSGYDGVCARCHGVPLTGSQGNGPTLKGAAFLAHWDKDTLGSLYTKIRDTMPQGTPGTLTDEVKLQILAYVLQQNGFRTGTSDLPGDVAALDAIGIQQRGVWDGVFTVAQADAGKQSSARCQGCHGPELSGTDRAPTLKGSSFLANWEDGSVNRLFTKVRDTMPPGNTDSLPPDVKLNIVAHLLRENGFPAGTSELTQNADTLDGLQITKKNADAGAPNFALVQVVGCLPLQSDQPAGWKLTQRTDRARRHARQHAQRRGARDCRNQAARTPDVRSGERRCDNENRRPDRPQGRGARAALPRRHVRGSESHVSQTPRVRLHEIACQLR